MLHKDLPESELHELKGASTALVNEVPVADGAGSSTWKTLAISGWEYITDSGTPQSLTSGSFVDITNNGTTNLSFRLPNKTTAWDTSNNEFDWNDGDLLLGDMITLRLDLVFSIANANDNIKVGIDLAHGVGSEFRLIFLDHDFHDTGTHNISVNMVFPINTSAVLVNPAKVVISTDGTGNTVDVTGWYVKVDTYTPIYRD